MTIFDDLTDEQQQQGDEIFNELINDVSHYDLASMTLEEAFKIGYAKGVGV